VLHRQMEGSLEPSWWSNFMMDSWGIADRRETWLRVTLGASWVVGEDPEVDEHNEGGKWSLVAKREDINKLTVSAKARGWTAMDETSIDNPPGVKGRAGEEWTGIWGASINEHSSSSTMARAGAGVTMQVEGETLEGYKLGAHQGWT
jgi:hypothetical protein